MLYVLVCEDKPNSESLRKAVREDHLAFLKNYDVRFAGPMLGDDETTMVGSIIVINVDNLEAAQAFAAADPYAAAGLFTHVTLRAFKQVIGA
ncbi:MAG: YciI family protein [Pseudomonadaceae bacterium]|nr:YciI family protein [Pseudomonadaceae bacterium]